MSQAVIIGNGDFPKKAYPRELIRQADIIVCCDRGFLSFLRHREGIFKDGKRLPDVVIGDMDSLPAQIQKEYSSIMVHVTEQEENDQTKAIRHILANFKDVDTIHIIGATGKRECHTIGNISLLMEYARLFGACGDPGEGCVYIDLVSDYTTSFAITDSCELMVGEGRAISIFTPDNSLQIKSEGLVWPTDGVHFDNWWKATLNKAGADTVKLTLSHKSIALVMLD